MSVVDQRPSPFGVGRRRRWPSIHWRSVAAVFVGGFFGGIARYGIGVGWPTPAGRFPWPTFLINTGGAFALALLIVLTIEVLPPTTYVRPALGTGVCGAFTTFSSVTTAVDLLAAHDRLSTAAGYLAASLLAGLAAASFGVATGRAVAANRGRPREGTG